MGRVSNAREHLLAAMTDLMWQNSYRSATVDAICAHAEVKKGSFYYFFESKSDLAVAALQAHWKNARPAVEMAFDARLDPLLRLLSYHQLVLHQQQCCVTQRNCTLGCPYVVLGSELCQRDEKILSQVRAILTELREHFSRAVQDLYLAQGRETENADSMAECLFNMFEGALTQARVYNDLGRLNSLPLGVIRLLGFPDSALAQASKALPDISIYAAA